MPTKQSSIDLTIIILAFQEAKRIGKTLKTLAAHLEKHNYGTVEVLVVAARGTDETLEIAKKQGHLFKHYRVIDAGERVGKGRDTRLGMLEARGNFRLFMDADLATPLKYIDAAVDHLQEGSDVAIAVRDLTSSHTGLRKLISSLGNLLVQIVLLPGVKDTQCGFKAFRAEAAEEIFRRQTVLGWGFDMEVLYIARKLKYETALIEAPDWKDVAGGTFKNVAVTGAAQTLKDLFGIKWKAITRRYEHKTFNYKPAKN